MDWVEDYANGFLQTGPRFYGFDNWLAMLALESVFRHGGSRKGL